MKTRRRLGSAVLLSIILLVGLAGTAQATILDKGPFSDSGTDTGACGAYDVRFNVHGYFKLQDTTPELGGEFFYYSEVGTVHVVYSNPANGKRFSESYSWALREHDAHQTGPDPNVFSYKTTEVAVWTIKNSRGKVVYFSPGKLVQSHLFDTGGDGVPGGEPIGDPVVLKDTFKPLDFCALADSLIG